MNDNVRVMHRIFALWQHFKHKMLKHEKVLWAIHSVWALTYGVLIMVFFKGDFGQVRKLLMSLMFLMLLIIAFDRIAERETKTGDKKRGVKLVLNYVMKNMYQALYFFMLPFYWDATQMDSIHWLFTAAVGVLAVLSTQDLFFDNFLMEHKWIRNAYYAFCLFASFHLLLPVLMPFPLHYTIMLSAFFAVFAFFVLHMPQFVWREKHFRWVLVIAMGSAAGCYTVRQLVPPVPYRVVQSGVTGEDLTLPGEAYPTGVHFISAADYRERPMMAFQIIQSPTFPHDFFWHEYRRGSELVSRQHVARRHLGDNRYLLYSRLSYDQIGVGDPTGDWTLVLRTEGGIYLKSHVFTIVE
ncbi:MAG: hypothetical protein CVU65_02980 [Deltaproteobacteria bacterium HGW-Deltaproteobacteria-22]|nr:MAG: hypothetical protein CVU65_02980 [Deltaproteobacteria bacterium HGW-Deltaproteobacteria-22]